MAKGLRAAGSAHFHGPAITGDAQFDHLPLAPCCLCSSIFAVRRGTPCRSPTVWRAVAFAARNVAGRPKCLTPSQLAPQQRHSPLRHSRIQAINSRFRPMGQNRQSRTGPPAFRRPTARPWPRPLSRDGIAHCPPKATPRESPPRPLPAIIAQPSHHPPSRPPGSFSRPPFPSECRQSRHPTTACRRPAANCQRLRRGLHRRCRRPGRNRPGRASSPWATAAKQSTGWPRDWPC